jgi:hypothetical protein
MSKPYNSQTASIIDNKVREWVAKSYKKWKLYHATVAQERPPRDPVRDGFNDVGIRFGVEEEGGGRQRRRWWRNQTRCGRCGAVVGAPTLRRLMDYCRWWWRRPPVEVRKVVRWGGTAARAPP